MIRHYILDNDDNPVLADLLDAYNWLALNRARQIIKKTFVEQDGGEPIEISTVFLITDHSYPKSDYAWNKPILWETIVCGGALDGEQHRYFSKSLAIIGHDELVSAVKKSLENNHKD